MRERPHLLAVTLWLIKAALMMWIQRFAYGSGSRVGIDPAAWLAVCEVLGDLAS